MKTLSRLIAGLWPTTRCIICGGVSDDSHPGLCVKCYQGLLERRDGEVFCDRCGSFYVERFRECPHCFMGERRFAKNSIFAAVGYEAAGAELVKNLKYRNRRDVIPTMAKLFFRYSDIDADFDVVTVVPLHPRRQRERGYNQGAELAKAIADGMGLPYEELLCRVVDTVSQTSLSYHRRRKNMVGAFHVKDSAKVEGRRVLVVDDVVTTGATSLECRKALRAAGAARVAIAAFAAGRARD